MLTVLPTSRKLSIDLRGVEGTLWAWEDIGAPWPGRLGKRAPFELIGRTSALFKTLIVYRSA